MNLQRILDIQRCNNAAKQISLNLNASDQIATMLKKNYRTLEKETVEK